MILLIKGGVDMLNEFSRIVGILFCVVFSVAIIFGCSFGIVGVFQTLASYDVNDIDSVSNKDADAIVASITGISIDEDSVDKKLVTKIDGIINGYDTKNDYSFKDAVDDANSALGDYLNIDIGAVSNEFANAFTSFSNFATDNE